jgi:hypothetical protein
MLFGQWRDSSNGSPVSRRLLRLERIIGHPVETAWMSFEPATSISWMSVNFTEVP